MLVAGLSSVKNLSFYLTQWKLATRQGKQSCECIKVFSNQERVYFFTVSILRGPSSEICMLLAGTEDKLAYCMNYDLII